jgi:hypothetical protein
MRFLLPLLIALSSPALAQQPLCLAHADITAKLSEQYAEKPISLGIANNGGVLEVLSAPKGKTWTIILTMTNGQSCMIAAGDGWRRRAMPTGGMDG